MNWNEFLIGVTGTYLLYYSANFGWDIIRQQRPGRGDPDEDLLFIADTSEPILVELSPPVPNSPDLSLDITDTEVLPDLEVQSPAGVDLQELYSLLHAGMIEETRSIPY